jgi:hypothetical protein
VVFFYGILGSIQIVLKSLFSGPEPGRMPYTVGALLPEYRIKASIDADTRGNLIHDDEYARRCGFRSGIVPGVSIYAYMAHTLIEFLGKEWLERGSADIRFVRPIYEGEEIRVSGALVSVEPDGTPKLDFQASNNQGVICGLGTAQLPHGAPSPEPGDPEYPARRAKLHRPISLELLREGDVLVPVTSEFTWNVHWQYCQKAIRDHHPLFQRVMHPGWLATQATRILSENFAIAAWIDVSLQVRNFHLQDSECLVETRGRVQGKFERNGDHYVVLDLAAFAESRFLQTIRYTAIFRIAPNAA